MKKVIALLLVLTMLFLIACTQPEPPAEVTPDDSAAPEVTEEEADEVADPVEEETVVVVGDAAIEGAEAEVVDVVFSESPWFEGRDYPPVEERLPRNPATWNWIPEEHMTFEVGVFGPGPLRTVRMSPTWDAIVWSANHAGLIISPGRLAQEFVPHKLESFDVNDELTEFTFTLREGMRWSDGHPVTTADAYFSFISIICNEVLNPVTSSWWRAGGQVTGEVGRIEIVDDYTWRMIFDEPYGGKILRMAVNSDWVDYLQPAHYLQDFHIDFADEDVLQQKVEDAGYIWPEEWPTFFRYHMAQTWDVGRSSQFYGYTPTLNPWIAVQDGDLRVFQRNPFYWMVDPEGRQLPYIDYVHSHFATDMAAAQIMLLGGQIDHSYEWMQLNQVPLFIENAAAGNYRVITTSELHRTDADILINQTYDDEVWRSMAQDVRFRRALSLAIDRAEIIEAVYFGFARISEYHDQPISDMALAHELLDEMGMEFGADGFRTAPDGTPFVMDFVYTEQFAQYAPTAQLVNEMWRELGINTNLRMIDNALLYVMADSNELQASVAWTHGTHGGGFEHWRNNFWGTLWFDYWNTAGASGEAPPPHVEEFFATIQSLRIIHPREIPNAREALRASIAEHYHYVIPVNGIAQVLLVNNDLRNVPERGLFIPGCQGSMGWWFDR